MWMAMIIILNYFTGILRIFVFDISTLRTSNMHLVVDRRLFLSSI